MRHGHSGARFVVVKSATGSAIIRLRAQYAWLVKHHANPYVAHVGSWVEREYGKAEGYELELLESYTGQWPQPVFVMKGIVTALRSIWAQPAARFWIGGSLVDDAYLDRFTWAAPDLRAWSREIRHVGPWCDIHGDPTLENALRRRETGSLVLIDPLPDPVANALIPSVAAVDIGKLVQSALNYEAVVNRRDDTWRIRPALLDVARNVAGESGTWPVTCWFAALHIARLTPYQEPDLQERWRAWWTDIHDALRSISTAS